MENWLMDNFSVGTPTARPENASQSGPRFHCNPSVDQVVSEADIRPVIDFVHERYDAWLDPLPPRGAAFDIPVGKFK